MSRRPANWYEMSSEEQRNWQRREDEMEDAIQEARRANDRVVDDSQRHRATMRALREQLQAAIEEGREEAAELRAQVDVLLTACRDALACIAGRGGWGALEAVLAAAIAKAEGQAEGQTISTPGPDGTATTWTVEMPQKQEPAGGPE